MKNVSQQTKGGGSSFRQGRMAVKVRKARSLCRRKVSGRSKTMQAGEPSAYGVEDLSTHEVEILEYNSNGDCYD